LLVSAIVTA